ncbi:gel scht [Duganella sp. BJB488]|uniref:gel scht n=1 Tax=unclassified Duganella TaxID=2636909 RepID=UPI000E353CC3|nr:MULTISPECIES: gel scht [unclassified Duganella]RFP16711.1 gel scht [Duganella sp. BJB489]RFP20864.1 gel scht [Duganella sp. BJB488]RFP32073.1 gel scht [Duganella sp. BJB480]
MKTTLFGVVAALAFAAMPAAHADEASVQIKGGLNRLHLQQGDFANFKNTYQLTNGQTLTFSQRMARYYTQLDDGQRVEIYAIAPDKFVTANGTRFEFSDVGESVGVANFARLPLAKANGETIVVARR